MIRAKRDTRSAVIARDFSIFDAPIIHEKEYDYDECADLIEE